MAKETIDFVYRYEQPYHRRKKQPWVDRTVLIFEKQRHGNRAEWIQKLGTIRIGEIASLEELIGQPFSRRRIRVQPDEGPVMKRRIGLCLEELLSN